MNDTDKAEARNLVQEILAFKVKLTHEERTYVSIVERCLEEGRALTPRDWEMLDRLWNQVVRGR